MIHSGKKILELHVLLSLIVMMQFLSVPSYCNGIGQDQEIKLWISADNKQEPDRDEASLTVVPDISNRHIIRNFTPERLLIIHPCRGSLYPAGPYNYSRLYERQAPFLPDGRTFILRI
jgi:hypothetical protein